MTSLTHTIPPLTFSIAKAHPSIAGHFPHNPLVAGAILLSQTQQYLQSLIQTDITSVSRLRFNQPVLPDEDIYVEFLQKNDHQWRFSGLVKGETAFKGVFSAAQKCDTDVHAPEINGAVNEPIDTIKLYQHLPHAGQMQLIDAVDAWDEQSIRCTTRSHLISDNPLRDAGKLPASSAIEYAAQTLALHGVTKKHAEGLLDSSNKAFVVSAKGLHFQNIDLASIDQALTIYATVLIGNAQSAVYSVQVCAGEHCLLRGDLGVMSGPIVS